jgi:aminomethyltransferase
MSLLQTPLHALHLELGARMVPFAGYEMPVQYPLGVMKEHLHTRTAAGLFDVSHMGQIILRGANADRALESLVPVDIIELPQGRQRYALFTDLMVARLDSETLFLVVNAACKQQDLQHLQHLTGHCRVEACFDRALLALQGPQAAHVLARLAPEVAQMTFMQFRSLRLLGIDCGLPAACSPNKKWPSSVLAPATRCAWKPACAFTDMTWARTPPP